MTAMYQGEGQYVSAVGREMKTHLPQETSVKIANDTGRFRALKQGSVGSTMSDLQFMQQNERKQHEDTYRYEHGHNDGGEPGWRSSF